VRAAASPPGYDLRRFLELERMTAEAFAAETEPSSTEYSTIWVAYVLAATGVLGFVFGPLVALIINYVRHDAEDAGFIATHHRWLIRTFWWSFGLYLLFLAVILASAWPILSDVLTDVIASGGNAREFSIGFDWDSLFATLGVAMAGGVGIFCIWIWNIYRILRGAYLLGDRRPAP